MIEILAALLLSGLALLYAGILGSRNHIRRGGWRLLLSGGAFSSGLCFLVAGIMTIWH